jgi:protein-disulfide isomerase
MNERLSRNEQREAARAKARAMREQAKKGEKRKRLIVQSSVVIGTLAIVGIVAAAIINGANTASVSGLTPKNFSYDDGIKLGVNAAAYTTESTPTPSATPGAKAPINIKMYIDYQCPVCKNFEAGNIDQIKSWLDSGYATLEVHPISFLDGKGSPNSTRAARQTQPSVLPRTHQTSSLHSTRRSLRTSLKRALPVQRMTSCSSALSRSV